MLLCSPPVAPLLPPHTPSLLVSLWQKLAKGTAGGASQQLLKERKGRNIPKPLCGLGWGAVGCLEEAHGSPVQEGIPVGDALGGARGWRRRDSAPQRVGEVRASAPPAPYRPRRLWGESDPGPSQLWGGQHSLGPGCMEAQAGILAGKTTAGQGLRVPPWEVSTGHHHPSTAEVLRL